MDLEPAVKARGANKTVMQKNNRASNNWLKVKKSLDREQLEAARGLDENRSKLLKQREKLQNTSLSLTSNPQAESVAESAGEAGKPENPQLKKLVSLAEVYEALLKSMKNPKDTDLRSVRSDTTARLTSGTQSFEQKRVTRKPINFSLQTLQRVNSNLSQSRLNYQAEKVIDEEEESTEKRPQSEPPGIFDLSEEEISLGPTLRLPPTCLPPITRSVAFEPRARNFQSDRNEARARSEPSSLEDVRYCRYLRTKSAANQRGSLPTTHRRQYQWRP